MGRSDFQDLKSVSDTSSHLFSVNGFPTTTFRIPNDRNNLPGFKLQVLTARLLFVEYHSAKQQYPTSGSR